MLHAASEWSQRSTANLEAAVYLQSMHYKFARPHKCRANPYAQTAATAAGSTDRVWTVEEIVGLLGSGRLLSLDTAGNYRSSAPAPAQPCGVPSSPVPEWHVHRHPVSTRDLIVETPLFSTIPRPSG
jgi:hypothetical protein